ncbi:LIM domain only protein 3-like isoform X1 [Hyposmocoma kahamanoa]|uniref:LIM domain only protein 3-like isoform X1 n=1 Tax=Hyposmocoma kahamanoa TaxID=1477025 RepID=UPI000E6D5E1D|nr:LIM domain only protein 3-like isoform X1 [Hyposmocoma kahamanoa]XP_026326414.1 LIM domain only protein 3-like isoform X1 [Hyposmocoma kahamanoa]
MIRDPPAMHKPDTGNSQQEDNKYTLTSGVASSTAGARLCAQCGKVITERFLLKAMERFWHEDCLKCGCCDCRLGEVGSKLYYKADLMLCKRDYLRLFGATGNCVACNKVIPAFEMVMRAKSFVYHLECFACQQCNHRFCVGDRFYLCDNKILCEYDYEERLVFASMAANPSGLAHIRRQVSGLPSPSGGYVSGSGCGAGVAAGGALAEKDGGGCAGADDASSGYGSPPDPDVCDAAR